MGISIYLQQHFYRQHSRIWGAIAGYSATGRIENCIFSENVADHGGAIYNYAAGGPEYVPIITNCTFWKNHAFINGGAIMNINAFGYPVPITNCILWENTAPLEPQIYNTGNAISDVTYCNIQGGYSGEGNINTDPQFLDPEENDFHLTLGSPSINSGTLDGAPANDIDGDTRPQGTGYDMGADEYTFNVPDILGFFDKSVLEGTLVGYGPGK